MTQATQVASHVYANMLKTWQAAKSATYHSVAPRSPNCVVGMAAWDADADGAKYLVHAGTAALKQPKGTQPGNE